MVGASKGRKRILKRRLKESGEAITVVEIVAVIIIIAVILLVRVVVVQIIV